MSKKAKFYLEAEEKCFQKCPEAKLCMSFDNSDIDLNKCKSLLKQL